MAYLDIHYTKEHKKIYGTYAVLTTILMIII
jgi:hypothetical protein